jgi:hypothetical protein
MNVFLSQRTAAKVPGVTDRKDLQTSNPKVVAGTYSTLVDTRSLSFSTVTPPYTYTNTYTGAHTRCHISRVRTCTGTRPLVVVLPPVWTLVLACQAAGLRHGCERERFCHPRPTSALSPSISSVLTTPIQFLANGPIYCFQYLAAGRWGAELRRGCCGECVA